MAIRTRAPASTKPFRKTITTRPAEQSAITQERFISLERRAKECVRERDGPGPMKTKTTRREHLVCMFIGAVHTATTRLSKDEKRRKELPLPGRIHRTSTRGLLLPGWIHRMATRGLLYSTVPFNRHLEAASTAPMPCSASNHSHLIVKQLEKINEKPRVPRHPAKHSRDSVLSRK
jgi:hypothetical protein